MDTRRTVGVALTETGVALTEPMTHRSVRQPCLQHDACACASSLIVNSIGFCNLTCLLEYPAPQTRSCSPTSSTGRDTDAWSKLRR
jgi:hypothetical protein